jgi:Na+-translocating ferredoxin:NAD+ oxidoreductase RnfD subunit
MSTIDPRYYQIAVLSTLLVYGIVALDFGVRLENAIGIIVAAQLTQFFASRAVGLERIDPLSALISSLSLTLLLRTDTVAPAVIAALIAIGSKFAIRFRGKHVFNPANVAIVVLILMSDHAWVSSGQWGSTTIVAFALACLGFLVLTRARRAETTIAFLAAFGSLVIGRAAWLGDPLSIPLHQLQNGALLLFAFFMISDPKTTPNSARGRIAYGVLVAAVTYVIRFVLYEPNAPIYALVLTAPLVPLIDAISMGRIYRWEKPKGDYQCDSSLQRPRLY